MNCRHGTGRGVHVIDWQAIVDEHGPHVWRTVYRLISHREDALDCYQETFLQAARYAKTHAVSNWRGLLRQMATARALDCMRRRYRTEKKVAPLEEAMSKPHGVPPPDVQAELRESVEQLRQTLVELPPKQCEVFCLRELEQMSTAAVAELLHVTPDEVAVRLHRAKVKLRQMLSDHDRPSRVRR